MVAAFSLDISVSLSLPCTLVVYLHRWNFLKGGLGVRRSPLNWHISDPRSITLSDQHPWTFTRSTISYGAPPWFFLLERIVNKMWDSSPMQRPKFLLPHMYIYIYYIFWETNTHTRMRERSYNTKTYLILVYILVLWHGLMKIHM